MESLGSKNAEKHIPHDLEAVTYDQLALIALVEALYRESDAKSLQIINTYFEEKADGETPTS